MVYSEDSTEKGKKCEITFKGETVACIVICTFLYVNKDKVVTRKYRLESKDKTIYDNILLSDVNFK